jgi:ATP-dependent DNA ligase
MHARIDGDDVRLLTRTGLDWRHRYPAIPSLSGRFLSSRAISTVSCAR